MQYDFGGPVVAELDTPLASKDSREKLHETKPAHSSATEEYLYRKACERLYDCFADTISEYLSSDYAENKALKVEDIYSILLQVVEKELAYFKKNYERVEKFKSYLVKK